MGARWRRALLVRACLVFAAVCDSACGESLSPDEFVSPAEAWRTLASKRRSGTGMNAMVPDLRFVVGAGVAISLLGLTTLGVFAAVRLAHQVKMGPLEASRSQAFADHAEWNPFYDPSSARLFQRIARAPDPEPPTQRAAEAPPPVLAYDAPVPTAEPAARGETAERIAASAVAAADEETVAAVPVSPLDPAYSAHKTAPAADKPSETAAVEAKAAAATPAPLAQEHRAARLTEPEQPVLTMAPPVAPKLAAVMTAPPAEPAPPAPVAAPPAVAAIRAPVPEPAAAVAVPANTVIPPAETALTSARQPAETGVTADTPIVTTATIPPPARGVVPAQAAAPAPLYAKIEEIVLPREKPPAVARPPKVRAKKKVHTPARPAARAAVARHRAHKAPRHRRVKPRVRELGPYFYGNNPWPQAQGGFPQNSGANRWPQ
jgi:hypothetical protein